MKITEKRQKCHILPLFWQHLLRELFIKDDIDKIRIHHLFLHQIIGKVTLFHQAPIAFCYVSPSQVKRVCDFHTPIERIGLKTIYAGH